MRTRIRIALAAALVVAIGFAVYGGRKYRDAARLRAQVQLLQARAEQGDAEAEAKLATAYVRGRGVPQDYDAALRWYRKSAEQGSPDGEVGMGAAYYYGYGVTRDNAESMKWYRKAAEQGNARGETGVAYIYEHGDGVARNDAEALQRYRKAADQGEKLAERELGTMYYYGQGVSPDYSEAARWYRKAANQGEAAAEYDLGLLYFYGRGVPRDRAEANRWFAKAANSGDVDGRRALALGLSSCTKLVLLVELLVGLYFLSFVPVRLHHLPASDIVWDRNRQVTVATGILCVLLAGLKWYGYTHLLLRRLGTPLNAFTLLRWTMELTMFAALVYVVRVARSEARAKSSFESIAGAES